MNIKNRTIFTGDNLYVLRGINANSVDLIYLDPPYNNKKEWSAPIGSKAAGCAFTDTWTLSDIDLAWHEQIRSQNRALHNVILAARDVAGDATMSYLLMVAPRLMEMKRVLKPTGSLYLHCDPTESHGLKLVLDAIFGRDRFRNEIVWKRTSSKNNVKNMFGRNTDHILFYGGRALNVEDIKVPFDDDYVKARYRSDDNDGRGLYMADNLRPPSEGHHYLLNGFEGPWRFSQERMNELVADNRIVMKPGRVPRIKRYLTETRGRVPDNLWDDINVINSQAKEDTGFPTQKPVALLERIIRASSNEGDFVLDPFCGCATAAIAAEKLGRQWIGIDLGRGAIELTQDRLVEELGLAASLAIHREDVPLRTDLGKLPPYQSHKPSLYGEQGGDCAGCGDHFKQARLHIDHIIPRKHGGTSHKENLQLLCEYCNRRKGTKPMSKLMERLLEDRKAGKI